MKEQSKEELVEVFATNVAAAWAEARAQRANKYVNRSERAWEALRAMGDEGREALAVLLKDPRPEVRCDAACRLLRYRTSEALKVLRECARRGGVIGLAAKLNMQRWKEGTWQMDPPNGVELPTPSTRPAPRPRRDTTGPLVLPSPLPRTVRWEDIPEWDRFDDRRVQVDIIYVNTIGVNQGYIEWTPNDEPPSKAESLAWLWVIRPDLGPKIAAEADDDLRQAIEDYESSFEE